MAEGSLQARYDIQPHFEQLVRGHGLGGRILRFCTAFLVIVIASVGVLIVDPPVCGIPLLKKVMTSLSKHSADVFCKLLVGVWGPVE